MRIRHDIADHFEAELLRNRAQGRAYLQSGMGLDTPESPITSGEPDAGESTIKESPDAEEDGLAGDESPNVMGTGSGH